MRTIVMSLFFVCNLFIFISGCDKKGTNTPNGKIMLSEQEIIKIANKKAKSIGYPIELGTVYFDKDNIKWKERVAFMKKYIPKLADECDRELNGHRFNTVLYEPKDEDMMGGILWIFIDPTSGDIIYMLPEM